MKLIRYNNDRFFVEVKEIEDWERPPMATIPGYLARRLELATHPARHRRGDRQPGSKKAV
jgi:hypothetical protein